MDPIRNPKWFHSASSENRRSSSFFLKREARQYMIVLHKIDHAVARFHDYCYVLFVFDPDREIHRSLVFIRPNSVYLITWTSIPRDTASQLRAGLATGYHAKGPTETE